MFKATIDILLCPSILDPRGKATEHALHAPGFTEIDHVRRGKVIEPTIDMTSKSDAERCVGEACEKLLANTVMENYEISLQELVRT